MLLRLLSALTVCSLAAADSYDDLIARITRQAHLGHGYGARYGGGPLIHDDIELGGHGANVIEGFGGNRGYSGCPKGLEQTIYGKCVEPLISQDLYLYKAPSYKVEHKAAYYDHKPRVHYSLVFIRSPSYEDHPLKPIVIPPPKQKTLVYLLSKKPHGYKQKIIEVPYIPQKPEVYFVNYKDGDNPVLPGGIDLQTALSQSAGIGGSKFGGGYGGGLGGGVGFGKGGHGIGGAIGLGDGIGLGKDDISIGGGYGGDDFVGIGSGFGGIKSEFSFDDIGIKGGIGLGKGLHGFGIGGSGIGLGRGYGGGVGKGLEIEIVNDKSVGGDILFDRIGKGGVIEGGYGGGHEIGHEGGFVGGFGSQGLDVINAGASGFGGKLEGGFGSGKGFRGSRFGGKGFGAGSKRIIINGPRYH